MPGAPEACSIEMSPIEMSPVVRSTFLRSYARPADHSLDPRATRLNGTRMQNKRQATFMRARGTSGRGPENDAYAAL